MSLSACTQHDTSPALIWKDDKAVAVNLSSWIKGIPTKRLVARVKISVEGDHTGTAILGSFREDASLFEPVVPFTRGMRYQVMVDDRIKGMFVVPADPAAAPVLLASYPETDTVPENLLKIYLVFSRPMTEGKSAQYVSLVKNDTDTLQHVFLDLQPELWNEDRTVLTLWLDPGRIKRDLQPNVKLGAPLQTRQKYTLTVSKDWRSTGGKTMTQNYTRSFTTTLRDEVSPDPLRWKTNTPARQSRQPLRIAFDQSLDHFLLLESLHITDASGKTLQGAVKLENKDRLYSFTPALPWEDGVYKIVIDSKLEDIAGNNLNRPFDRDVTQSRQPSAQAYHQLSFIVK